jgi:hypothetical protein
MSIDTEYLTVDEPVTYTSPEIVDLTGASYRQIDYWCRTGRLSPSLRGASGSGSSRLFDKFDLEVVRIVVWLVNEEVPVERAFNVAAQLLAGQSHRAVLNGEFELIIRPIIPTA